MEFIAVMRTENKYEISDIIDALHECLEVGEDAMIKKRSKHTRIIHEIINKIPIIIE